MFLSAAQRQRIRAATAAAAGGSGDKKNGGSSGNMSQPAAKEAAAAAAGGSAAAAVSRLSWTNGSGSANGSGGSGAGGKGASGGRRGVNLLRVGTDALRRELEAREAAEAAIAAVRQEAAASSDAAAAAAAGEGADGGGGGSGSKRKAPFNWQQFVRPKQRVDGQAEGQQQMTQQTNAPGDTAAAAAAADASAPMTDVWADEVQSQSQAQPDTQPLVCVSAAPVAFSQPDPTTDLDGGSGGGGAWVAQQQQQQQQQPALYAGGAAMPVAMPYAPMQAASYTHVLQPHQQQHFNSHYAQQQQQQWQGRIPAGGRRGRAIRTPHAMPGLHQIDLAHSPASATAASSGFAAAAAANFQRIASAGMPMPVHMPQLDALFAAQPPPHGHPPSFHAMQGGGSSGDGDVVDLTQETEAHPGSQEDEVQVLSVTQGAGGSSGGGGDYTYNAFNPAFSTASASAAASYGAYAAAFRMASAPIGATSLWSPPPVSAPAAPVPLSTDQFAGLSKEQQAVVMAIMRGSNVFFSGCAGTGKSHLLKLLAQFLPRSSTFFTASTGLAAVNIGGSTLHSFAGIGLGEGSAEKLGFKARGNKRSRARWLDCKVLVIDEISMISGQLFDKLEAVARFVRGSDRPFGGIQLVLSGDFLQLPPVKATKPTFRADCWERCVQVRIVLTKVFRQQGDPTFINLLGNLRMGVLSLKDECILKKSHYNPLPAVHGVMPTKLNALKRDTADENAKFLAELPGGAVTFRARDAFKSEAHMQLLAKDCPAAGEIHLKQHAQVMLLKNLDPAAGLCNGSRGIVIDFVKLHAEGGGVDGEGVEALTNLATAGAGAAVGAAAAATSAYGIQMDDNGCAYPASTAGGPAAAAASASAPAATPGAGAVGGSGSTNGGAGAGAGMVTLGSGSTVAAPPADGVGINPHPYWADEATFGGRLSQAHVHAGNADDVYYLPRVQFDNGAVRVIEPDKFEIVVQDVVQAQRTQVPLTLAWALTIHKSQGMTLERAEINAQGMFENGQLYVAVSRVKSIPGLRLRGFTRDCMRTDQAVVDWYRRLAAETERSTQELLKDVDKEFPNLTAYLEEQKAQKQSEEAEGAKDAANAGAGAGGEAAAAASSSTAASAAAAASATPNGSLAPADASSRSSSVSGLAFARASTLVQPGSAAAAALHAHSHSHVKREPLVKKEPAPLFPSQHAASPVRVGPPPQAFRSPLKDPVAAAASTAAAAAELAAVNAANAAAAAAAASAAPSSSSNACCVCLNHKAEWIVLECMHLCLCGECQEEFGPRPEGNAPPATPHLCPVCREPILKIKKVFAS